MFWPPFLLLLFAVLSSFFYPEAFLKQITGINDWILNQFSLVFSLVAFLMFLVCLIVSFTPLGNIRIGGEDAKPILSRWKWFSIILCTTVAIGILFWGTAEPLFHITEPPESLGILSFSKEAEKFSMSILFLHWSFTPYAIYCVPALMFALCFYNAGKEFSLVSPMYPIIKGKATIHIRPWVDSICLFALVAGMAASLGAGILSLSGGIRYLFPLGDTFWLTGLITFFVILTFTVSAATGLLRGIRFFSDINLKVFLGLLIFLLFAGSAPAIFKAFIQGTTGYLSYFLPISLNIGPLGNDPWIKLWSVFYWANWMAWAPVTALFLGRIAYGRTVKEFLLFNWVLPSCFGIFWMSVFGGMTIQLASENNLLFGGLLENLGPESVIYTVLELLPLAVLSIPVFIIAVFVSYVTAADSNTEAMAALSSRGIEPDSPEASVKVKVIWGITIGLVAWIMISAADIQGIRMLSNLGGLPAMFLLFIISLALIRVAINPNKFFKK